MIIIFNIQISILVAKIETFLEKNDLIQKKVTEVPTVKPRPQAKKVLVKSAVKIPPTILKRPDIARLVQEIWRYIDGTKSRQEIVAQLKQFKPATIEKIIAFMIQNSLIDEQEKTI